MTQKPSFLHQEKIFWTLKGFALGVALLIPGLSAGTLALIMGIYEKTLTSLTKLNSFFIFFLKWSFYLLKTGKIKKEGLDLESTWFLLCLSLGALLALFVMAKPFSFLLSYFPIPVYAFFMGLIIAGLPSLLKMTGKVTGKVTGKNKLKVTSFLWIFFWTLLFLIIFQKGDALLSTFWIKLDISSNILLFLSLSGFLAVFASVLPGLSGSFILLLIGAYHPVLISLAEREWLKLIFFAIGGFFGLLSAIYTVRFFLKAHKKHFFCFAIGLIIASLPIFIPHSLTKLSLGQWAQVGGFSFLGGLLFFLLTRYVKPKDSRLVGKPYIEKIKG